MQVMSTLITCLWHICRLHNVPERGERYVLVFDLGGGTLDVVLLRHSAELLEVCRTAVQQSLP